MLMTNCQSKLAICDLHFCLLVVLYFVLSFKHELFVDIFIVTVIEASLEKLLFG